MNEKQKKPKRKQITVSPETKRELDIAYGDYIKINGYVPIGQFCDTVIALALVVMYAEQEMDGGEIDISPIPGDPPWMGGHLPPVSEWKSMGTFKDAAKGEGDIDASPIPGSPPSERDEEVGKGYLERLEALSSFGDAVGAAAKRVLKAARNE
jgi:hypothetical protein